MQRMYQAERNARGLRLDLDLLVGTPFAKDKVLINVLIKDESLK